MILPKQKFIYLMIAALVGLLVTIGSVFLQWDSVEWWVHLVAGGITALLIYLDIVLIGYVTKDAKWRQKNV
jgi:membrane protein YdbS with pleckstrin-like domain